MNEPEIILRKIKLKNQALTLIKAEIQHLQARLVLLKLKDKFELKIGKSDDPLLSRKLDCVAFLLEN